MAFRPDPISQHAPVVRPPCGQDEGSSDVDVLVVGAGLAGLTAAAFASRRGARVLLVERSTSLGGRAATREEDGFLFNVGPHALYNGGPAQKAMAELGVKLSGRRPSASGGLALHRGSLHALPGGFVSLLSTDLLRLGAKFELARVLGSLPRLDPSTLRGKTLAAWLGETFRDDVVRGLVEGLTRLTSYANDPTRSCAAAAVAQLQAGIGEGVLYLDGGWQTLVDGLKEAAQAAGATVKSGCRVRSLSQLDGGFEALLEPSRPTGGPGDAGPRAGETVRARSVVLAVPPAVAASIVEGPASATLASWSASAVPVKAACLDLGLRRLPDPRRLFVVGVDRPLYFSVHSASARLAPDGAALVHVAKYLGSDDGDAKAVEAELEAFCDLVQPGWRSVVARRRYLPSMLVTSDLVEAGRARPGPEVPGAPGLFVAGDWVGQVSMIADTAVASGRQAGLGAAVLAGAQRQQAFAAAG